LAGKIQNVSLDVPPQIGKILDASLSVPCPTGKIPDASLSVPNAFLSFLAQTGKK
jgi:hypothetical protein